jgi:hypothetical protein
MKNKRKNLKYPFIELHNSYDSGSRFFNVKNIICVSEDKRHIKGGWRKPCRDVFYGTVNVSDGGYLFYSVKETKEEIMKMIEEIQK